MNTQNICEAAWKENMTHQSFRRLAAVSNGKTHHFSALNANGDRVSRRELRLAFYYFLLFLAVFNVVSDWKPLATAGMSAGSKLNVVTDIWV